MPLLNSTAGQRFASSRNRQTRTTVSVAENSRYGSYTVVRCEDHGQEHLADSWNAGCTVARTPQEFCLQCREIAPTVNRQQRRSNARAARRVAGARLGTQRRFGVEFEFYGMQRYTVEAWLRSSGKAGQGWRVKSDCSIRPASGQGLEVVSPPLRGEAGITQMREVLEYLNANGGDVNRTCGTHVHFEVADLGATGLRNFALTYNANQDLINWLVSPSRRGAQTYLGPFSSHEADSLERATGESLPRPGSRYRNVNLHAYGRYGTVEVRQHQGTLSFEKMVAWIKLGMGLLDTCVETGDKVAAQPGIRSLLNVAQCDEDVSAFIIGRAVQFGAPTATVAA